MTDYFKSHEGDLRRYVTFEGTRKTFLFRIASGRKVTQDGPTFTVDDMTIYATAGIRIRNLGNTMELVFQVDPTKHPMSVRIEYRW